MKVSNTCNVYSPEPIVVKDLHAKAGALEGTEGLLSRSVLTPCFYIEKTSKSLYSVFPLFCTQQYFLCRAEQSLRFPGKFNNCLYFSM